MRINPKSYVGIYGNAAIVKEWCQKCKRMAFVLEGVMACCDRAATTLEIPECQRREMVAEQRRLTPSKRHRETQMELQKERCFYCDLKFGDYVTRRTVMKTRLICLRVHWDHRTPYSYSQNNKSDNFVAACHVCNLIKHAKCFETVEEARAYVQKKRKAKGCVP